MASGAFSQATAQSGGRPQTFFASHSRSTSFSSQSRPSTATTDPGSVLFQDAFEEQDTDELDRSFEQIKDLLSLVGSVQSQHQLGGYAQHAFPRVFRAHISQRRVVEELDALRALVTKATESNSRPGSSSSSIMFGGTSIGADGFSNPGSGFSTPVRRRGSGALEDSAIDMDFLTPVAEEREDPITKTPSRTNHETPGVGGESGDSLAKALAQVQSLEVLLAKNEQEVCELKKRLGEDDDITSKNERRSRSLTETYNKRIKKAIENHQANLKKTDEAMRDLKERHAKHRRETSQTLNGSEVKSKSLLEQHERQLKEQELVFATRLAEKDDTLHSERKQHQIALKELEEGYEREKEVDFNHWQKEIALHKAKTQAIQTELEARKEKCDVLQREHSEQLQSKNQQLTKADRRLEEVTEKHAKACEEQSASHQRALSEKDEEFHRLQREHKNYIQQLLESHAIRLTEANKNLEESARKHAADLEQRATGHQKAIQEKSGQLAQLHEEHDQYIHKLEDEHSQALAQSGEAHQKAQREAEERFTKLKDDQDRILFEARQKHAEEMRLCSNARQQALESKKQQIAQVEGSREQRIQELKDRHANELKRNIEAQQRELQEKDRELTKLKSTHTQETTTLEQEHAQYVQQCTQEYEQKLDEISHRLSSTQEDHNRQIQELRNGNLVVLNKQQETHQKKVNETEGLFKQRLDEHNNIVRELRGNLENAEKAQASVLDLRNQLLARDQDGNKIQKEHEQEIEAIQAIHKQAIEQVSQDLVDANKKLEQTEAAHEASKTSYEKELMTRNQQANVVKRHHEQIIEDMKVVHQSGMEQEHKHASDELATVNKKLKDVEKATQVRIDDLESKLANREQHNKTIQLHHEHKLEAIQADHQSKLADVEQKHSKALQDVQSTHESALIIAVKGLKADHERELELAKTEHLTAIQSLRQAKEALKKENNDRVAHLEESHNTAMEQVKRSHEVELQRRENTVNESEKNDTLKMDQRERIQSNDINEPRNSQESTTGSFQKLLDEMEKSYGMKLSLLREERLKDRQQHEEQIVALKSTHESVLANQREGASKQLDELKQRRQQVPSPTEAQPHARVNGEGSVQSRHQVDLDALKQSHEEDLAFQNARIIHSETQLQAQSRQNRSLRERLDSTTAILNTLRIGSNKSYASHLRTTHERLDAELASKAKIEDQLARRDQQRKDSNERVQELLSELNCMNNQLAQTNRTPEDKPREMLDAEELAVLKQHLSAATRRFMKAEKLHSALLAHAANLQGDRHSQERPFTSTGNAAGLVKPVADARRLRSSTHEQPIPPSRHSTHLDYLTAIDSMSRAPTPHHNLRISPEAFENTIHHNGTAHRPKSKHRSATEPQSRPHTTLTDNNNRPISKRAPDPPRTPTNPSVALATVEQPSPHTPTNKVEPSSPVSPPSAEASPPALNSTYMLLRKSSREREAERYGGSAHKSSRQQQRSADRDDSERKIHSEAPAAIKSPAPEVTKDTPVSRTQAPHKLNNRPASKNGTPESQKGKRGSWLERHTSRRGEGLGRWPSLAERWSGRFGKDKQ